jgi:hypothetical protein
VNLRAALWAAVEALEVGDYDHCAVVFFGLLGAVPEHARAVPPPAAPQPLLGTDGRACVRVAGDP